MSSYDVCGSELAKRPRLLISHLAAPAGALGSGGGFTGGSALPMLDSDTRPAPSAALVARYSAPVLMKSRRRAYSSGAVISELGGGRGESCITPRLYQQMSASVRRGTGSSWPNQARFCAISDLCFGGARQRLARCFGDVRLVGATRELLACGGGNERAARLFLQHALVSVALGVLARRRCLDEAFAELFGELVTRRGRA